MTLETKDLIEAMTIHPNGSYFTGYLDDRTLELQNGSMGLRIKTELCQFIMSRMENGKFTWELTMQQRLELLKRHDLDLLIKRHLGWRLP